MTQNRNNGRKFAGMTVQVDILPLIVAIEEASGLTWDYIVENDVTEWIELYNEEIELMNNTKGL